MALLIQQTLAAKQAITAPSRAQAKRINTILTVSALIGMVSLSACQTAPTAIKTSSLQTLPSITQPTTAQRATSKQSTTKQSTVQQTKTQQTKTQQTKTQQTTANQAPVIENRNNESNDYKGDVYTLEPYTPPEQPTATNPLTEATPVYTPSTQSPIVTQPDSHDAIILTPSREDYMIPEPSLPSHSELLERARQNSQQRTHQSTANNSNLPAFRNLMQVGTEQLKSGNLNGAESSFTRAQRLAPKSSAVYFYLAQVALKKNQPRKAEAMARRGLTVAQDSNRRRALWQIILQSGQAQGNARVVKEAKQALR